MNEKNNSSKKLVIAVICLTILVCLLGGYIAYCKILPKDINKTNSTDTAGDKKEVKNSTVNNTEINKITLSGSYSKGDIISSVQSGFIYNMLVLNDTNDYVTVLMDVDLQYVSENNRVSDEEWQILSDEYYDAAKSYDNSKIKEYIESKRSIFSDILELKEVGGYEIRLAKVEELLALDNDYQEDNSLLVKEWKLEPIKANKSVMEFINGIMTMTDTNYNGEGKIAKFYSTGSKANLQSEDIDEYFITTWSSGMPAFKPVLNIAKK